MHVSNDPQMLSHTSQAEFSVLQMAFVFTNGSTPAFVKTKIQVTNYKFVFADSKTRVCGRVTPGHTPPKWLSLGPSDTGHG